MQLLGAHQLTALFTSWLVYCLAAAGFAGFMLMESSFNAGPLRASLPGMAAAGPVSGILLGMVVFGDPVFVSPGMLALRAAGMATLIIGVILVARAPALSVLRQLPLHHGLAVARVPAELIAVRSRPRPPDPGPPPPRAAPRDVLARSTVGVPATPGGTP